ncbi:MAG: hypothetical protein ABI430_02600 [Candidatus Taylorbacteria bacterium]
MLGNFSVQIESFARRHFIKSFQKKYKSKWDFTLIYIIEELARLDNFLKTDRAETIIDAGDIKIVKTKFRVAGTNESAKASGNRCIVAWCISKQSVSILLVYGKTDLSGKNETANWKALIKDNYKEYSSLF